MPDHDKSSTGRRLVVAAIAIALLAAGAAGAYWLTRSGDSSQSTAQMPPPPLVTSAPVESVERLTIRQTGFVRPGMEVAVASDVPGRIDQVHEAFQIGRFVDEGTPLITLRQDRFDADLQQAQAGLQQARAAVEQATANVAR